MATERELKLLTKQQLVLALILLQLLLAATENGTRLRDECPPWPKNSNWEPDTRGSPTCSVYHQYSISTCDGRPLTWEPLPQTDVSKFCPGLCCQGNFEAEHSYMIQPTPLVFVTQPVSQTSYHIGAKLNLSCSITACSNAFCPNITWVRSEDNNWKPSLLSSSVTHSTIAVSDNGTYYCRVEDGNFTIRSVPATVVLNEHEPYNSSWTNSLYNSPALYSSNVIDLDIPQGGTALLDCSLQDQFGLLSWVNCDKVNCIDVSTGVKAVTDFQLPANSTFVNVFCSVYYPGHSDARGMQREFKLSYSQDTQSSPVFTVSPRSQKASPGNTVTLYCLANGSSHKYTWLKNGQQIVSSLVHQVLTFRAVESANYTCVVTDQSTGASIQASAYVHVLGEPVVSIYSHYSPADANITVTPPTDIGLPHFHQQPFNITFICQVKDLDQPLEYYWFFRGSPVHPNTNSLFSLINDSTLLLLVPAGTDVEMTVVGSIQCHVRGLNGWGASQMRIKIEGKLNPPVDFSIARLPANEDFDKNFTYKLSWSSPLSNGPSQNIHYKLVMYRYLSGKICKFALQVVTDATCILYDSFCDSFMFGRDDGVQRFYIAAIGSLYDSSTSAASDYVTTEKCVTDAPANPISSTVHLNLSTSRPQEVRGGFYISFSFNSISASYNYYSKYAAADWLNYYYNYTIVFSSGCKLIDKTNTEDLLFSDLPNTQMFGCLTNCSWLVNIIAHDDDKTFIAATNWHNLTTPALTPSQRGSLSAEWIGNSGTDVQLSLNLPPSSVTCGLTYVSIYVTCGSSSSFVHNIPAPVNVSQELSINSSHCWESCAISYTYSNPRGTSERSNVVTLPDPTSNNVQGLTDVNIHILPNGTLNITWSLADGMLCLINRGHINDQADLFLQHGHCPSQWNSQWTSDRSLSKLSDGYALIEPSHATGAADDKYYCMGVIVSMSRTHTNVSRIMYNMTANSIPLTDGSSSATVGVMSSTTSILAPTTITDSASWPKEQFIIGGAAIGGVIVVLIMAVFFVAICKWFRRKKGSRRQNLHHDLQEDTQKLLDDGNVSVTSEKTDYTKPPYDEERMKRFLDSVTEAEDPTTHAITIEAELEPTDLGGKTSKTPSRKNQFPTPLLGSLPSQNTATVSTLLHGQNGYCYHGNTSAAALNKLSSTSGKLNEEDVELDLFDLTEPGEEPLAYTDEKKAQVISLNGKTDAKPFRKSSREHQKLSPSFVQSPSTSQTQPKFVPYATTAAASYLHYNAPTSKAQLQSNLVTPTKGVPLAPSCISPVLTNYHTPILSDDTPTPSKCSSTLSVATVEGGASIGVDSSRTSLRDSLLELSDSSGKLRTRRKPPHRKTVKERTRVRRVSSGGTSSRRRASNRSSSSSGILSSSGSSDSVFQSSSSTGLGLVKPPSSACTISHTRHSSGFQSSPDTPNSGQEGRTKYVDKGQTCFPFPPFPPPSSSVQSRQEAGKLSPFFPSEKETQLLTDYIFDDEFVTNSQFKNPVSSSAAATASFTAKHQLLPGEYVHQNNHGSTGEGFGVPTMALGYLPNEQLPLPQTLSQFPLQFPVKQNPSQFPLSFPSSNSKLPLQNSNLDQQRLSQSSLNRDKQFLSQLPFVSSAFTSTTDKHRQLPAMSNPDSRKQSMSLQLPFQNSVPSSVQSSHERPPKTLTAGAVTSLSLTPLVTPTTPLVQTPLLSTPSTPLVAQLSLTPQSKTPVTPIMPSLVPPVTQTSSSPLVAPMSQLSLSPQFKTPVTSIMPRPLVPPVTQTSPRPLVPPVTQTSPFSLVTPVTQSMSLDTSNKSFEYITAASLQPHPAYSQTLGTTRQSGLLPPATTSCHSNTNVLNSYQSVPAITTPRDNWLNPSLPGCRDNTKSCLLPCNSSLPMDPPLNRHGNTATVSQSATQITRTAESQLVNKLRGSHFSGIPSLYSYKKQSSEPSQFKHCTEDTTGSTSIQAVSSATGTETGSARGNQQESCDPLSRSNSTRTDSSYSLPSISSSIQDFLELDPTAEHIQCAVDNDYL